MSKQVVYQHRKYAGKTIFENVVIRDAKGCTLFLKECRLMSTLRHPHIVQFIGLCFLPWPTIILELLEITLDHFLKHAPNLPLSLKMSFLEGIASGLLYLHMRQPPVVHNDLKPQCIRLTLSLVPKIAGMSNCQVIGTKSAKLRSSPGSLWCKPPEAFGNHPSHGLPLDVFAFGHLALCTLTQVN